MSRLDLVEAGDALGAQRQLAATQHGGRYGDVLQQGAAAQLVLHDQADLRQASGRADLLEERLVKGADVARRVPRALAGGELAQRVDHARRVDVFGAARAAGLAGEAQPQGVVAEEPLAVVGERQAHDVVRRQCHLAAHGAAGRAFAALIAAGHVEVGRAPQVGGQGFARGSR